MCTQAPHAEPPPPWLFSLNPTLVALALAGGAGLGAGRPHDRDEQRDRQRQGAAQGAQPGVQPPPPGQDHPGAGRAGGWRRRHLSGETRAHLSRKTHAEAHARSRGRARDRVRVGVRGGGRGLRVLAAISPPRPFAPCPPDMRRGGGLGGYQPAVGRLHARTLARTGRARCCKWLPRFLVEEPRL
eukprot:31146-Chlamydomonas_euryale.AAC.7